jgi:hypothetical protein
MGMRAKIHAGYGQSSIVASTTMSEHEKHTEFLKRCIRYDESASRQKLMEEIHQIQRDLRCVGRAVWLMALLTALSVAGLAYEAIFADNLTDSMPQFIIKLFCGLGMGLLVSLLAFTGLGMVYRLKLNQRREECREVVTTLLESRLGKPVTTPCRDNRAGEEDASPTRGMAGTAPGSSTGRVEQQSKP